MTPPQSHPSTRRLSPTLVVEDHGTEFYFIFEGEGHDLTLSIDTKVAAELSEFLSQRLLAVPR